MAYMSVSYPSFASGATISAAEFNTNFGEITDGLSDGTKAIGVGAVTAASHVDLNSTLQVASAATFSGPVYTESTFRATGGATFSGTVAFGNTVQYSAASTYSAAVYTNSTFRNTGGATFSAAVNINTLTVSQPSTFSSVVYLDGGISMVSFASSVRFNDSINVAGVVTASAGINFNQSTMDYYEKGSFDIRFTTDEVATAITDTVYYQRIGSFVCIDLPAMVANSNTSVFNISPNGTFPTAVSPQYNDTAVHCVVWNTTYAPGMIYINNSFAQTWAVKCLPLTGASQNAYLDNFEASGQKGLVRQTIQYNVK